MLRSEGVGLMVWSPLAGGLLSGKYTREGAGEGRRTSFAFPPVDQDRAFGVIDVMQDIAGARGATVAQVALAWLLYQPQVSTVIVGARKAEQLADNIGACDVTLGKDDLDRLDQASRLADEYPAWMYQMQGTRRTGSVSPRRVAE